MCSENSGHCHLWRSHVQVPSVVSAVMSHTDLLATRACHVPCNHFPCVQDDSSANCTGCSLHSECAKECKSFPGLPSDLNYTEIRGSPHSYVQVHMHCMHEGSRCWGVGYSCVTLMLTLTHWHPTEPATSTSFSQNRSRCGTDLCLYGSLHFGSTMSVFH